MTHERERLAEILGAPVSRVTRLHGGMVADVQLVALKDGRRFVAKESRETPLDIEAEMLLFLRRYTSLPVPEVVEASPDLLLLEYVEGESRFGPGGERHAAELLAELHATTPAMLPMAEPAAASFGFYFDTLIGPFEQRNRWSEDWPSFYGRERLEPMIEECVRRGRLDDRLATRLRALQDDLRLLLDHSPAPGLVHGDVWSGNVLASGDRIAAFLDPAIYFADPEVELAFIEMFSTFGPAFWSDYEALRGIAEGYEGRRREIYQLYPLLVHVALFGGSYVVGVEERLRRLGY